MSKLPKGWAPCTLGEICTRFKRVNSDAANLSPLSVTKSEGIVLQSERFNKRIATDTSKYLTLHRGEFAYDPMSLYYGAIGRLTSVSRGVVSPAYLTFRVSANVDHDFFWFLVKSPQMQAKFNSATKGGSLHGKRRKIDWQDYQALSVHLPPIHEQRKIASILMSVETAIAQTKSLVSQLEAVNNGLMRELLTRGLPGHHPRFTETEIGRLPSDWKVVPLGTVVARERKAVTVDHKAEYREIGVRSHGRGIFHKKPCMGDAIGNKKVFRVTPDRLIVNIVFAWECALAITGKREAGMICSHRFPQFYSTDSGVDLAFILHFLLSPRGCRMLGLASPGGAGRNRTLNLGEFLQIPVPVPPLDEQRRICQLAESISSYQAAARDKLDGLSTLKSALASNLLTGKVRVTFDREDASR